MRGKALAPAPTIDIIGITPAYAGKSRILSSFPTRFWDHPRVCGEKFTTLHGENDFWGSPPRMRGKACGLFQLVESPGITPAYAGKREGPKNAQSKVGDHPRVCGEKRYAIVKSSFDKGSPPRMRGKAEGKAEIARTLRITPAYAGKSYHARHMVIIIRDHPRVCGEKARTLIVQNEPQGSPPRMRGKGSL